MASNGDSAGSGTVGSAAGGVLEPGVPRGYALVADGERGAVVGPDGSVAWLCVPRYGGTRRRRSCTPGCSSAR